MSDEVQPTTEEPAAGPAQVDMEARFDGDMRMAGALTREQNIRVNHHHPDPLTTSPKTTQTAARRPRGHRARRHPHHEGGT